MQRRKPLFSKPSQTIIQIVQPKRGFMGWVQRVCAGIGALVIIGFAIGAIAGLVTNRTITLPNDILLTLTLDGDAPEYDRYAQFSPLLGETTETLSQLVDALEMAAKDDRVKGLYLTINDGDYTPSQAEVLRNAINRFRAKGKFVTTYADSLLDGGNGMAAAMVAGASDALYLQPGGTLSLTGFHAEIPYYHALLQKFGIEPEIGKREAYKTAPEPQLLDAPSAAQRETISMLLTSITDEFLSAFSTDRGLPIKTVLQDVVSNMPMSGQMALQKKYVQGIEHAEHAQETALKHAGKKPKKVEIAAYFNARLSDIQPDSKKQIAIIYMDGMILGGDQTSADLVSANPYSDALKDVADDDSIKALVIRVNSPGGTPQGAEKIRNAIEMVKLAGKPVYISMGSVAASGGYWITADATKIGVQRLTITGSIGVYGGKFNVGELAKKWGVSPYAFATTDTSGMWSMFSPYTQSGKAANERMLDTVYADFKNVVAKGRNLDLKTVDELAQGKVYMGPKAVEVGLADIIADQAQMEDMAAKDLGYKDRFAVSFVDMTPGAEPFGLLEEFMGVRIAARMQGYVKTQVQTAQSGTVLNLPNIN